jgi:heterodisulfide reductase subunit D
LCEIHDKGAEPLSDEDITEKYKELIRVCAQCGTCTASCPTKEVSDFNIRKLVRHLQLEIHEDSEFLGKDPWLCTLCFRCKELCTEGLAIPKLVWALRELALEKEVAPKEVKSLLGIVNDNNSPYVLKGREKTSRIKPPLESSEDSKTLFWLGCTPSIKTPNIISSMAEVMKQKGLDFKVLENEPCCGEPLICLGLMDESEEIAEKVVEAIKGAGVEQVIVPCSGCYNAFTKLYPEMLGVELSGVEILHSSQYLEKNLGGLKLETPLKVTYHDPCTLGRHAGIYDEPRKVLEKIEGIELIEMDRNREFTSCCGGGGGLPSLNQKMPMEIAEKKLSKEVLPLGVDALVTSCPMCAMNFKFTATKYKIPLKIYDLSEIVAMCVQKES